MTNAQSPAGPNFQSERELALVGPQAGGGGGPRARRPSVLDSNVAPSELLAGGGDLPNGVGMGPGGLGGGGGTAIGVVGGPPGARGRARTNSSLLPPGGNPNGVNSNGGNANGNSNNGNGYVQPMPDPVELQNARAVEVLDRVQQKLTGRDFKIDEELEVQPQVSKLIGEATKLENLCQHYIGWCSFW